MILTVWLAACGADRDTLNGEAEAAGTAAASDTVAGAAVDAHSRQTFYLWEEGNMPSQT